MHGFRKWSLAAYAVLSVYLFARPSPDGLAERAKALDERLQAQPASALSPALAQTLGMPESSIACFLRTPNARPSDLVFNKLLDRQSAARGNLSSSAAVAESDLPVKEALAYFDAIEEQITACLRREGRKSSTLSFIAQSPSL